MIHICKKKKETFEFLFHYSLFIKNQPMNLSNFFSNKTIPNTNPCLNHSDPSIGLIPSQHESNLLSKVSAKLRKSEHQFCQTNPESS